MRPPAVSVEEREPGAGAALAGEEAVPFAQESSVGTGSSTFQVPGEQWLDQGVGHGRN